MERFSQQTRSFGASPQRRALPSSTRRQPNPQRGLTARILLLALIAALIVAPATALLPGRTAAESGWQWYMVDTHVHSSVSSDAYADVGIHANAAATFGYNALFLTDHNGGSSFHINNLTANHMAFEDSYTRWEQATFGTVDSSTNTLVTAPVNTGTHALRLRIASSDYGEAFVWTKRGPNFRSGDITLKVSIYPTQIDAGSGVYVSVSIGGDPTISKGPYGYTTQDGVVSPGKSTVLVWQLGSARAPSTDPDQRVLVYSLGDYTLNAWNHYTINVTQALADIPAADRPLDYNGLTFLKMAVAGNGGTAEAYFDTYSIDASNPVEPADEFVSRTPWVDDFDTSTLKVFASYEMGQQKHTNRFNFAITDPAQYVSYLYGSDGIVETQKTGYPAQLNHPGTTITAQEAIETRGKGADFLEVRDEDWIAAWDAILAQGTQIIGTWSSDTHSGVTSGKAATFVYAPALDFNELMRSLFEGRTYSARNYVDGRVLFTVDPVSSEPYPARYPVYVSDAQATADVRLVVTDDLRSSYTVRWIRNGEVFASENPPGSSYDVTKAIPLDGPFTYVRAEILSSSGSLRAVTQPIFFIDIAGLPGDKRLHIDRTTTIDNLGYNVLLTKGIIAASWSPDIQALSLTLNNRVDSVVRLLMQTDTAPDRVKVDGTVVPVAETLADFDAATSSTWYYDSATARLYLKIHHADTTADVLVAFSAETDTQPPTPPSNLTASAIHAQRVDLSWDPSTDDIGVSGYDIYRDGALVVSIGPETSYTDTTVSGATTYTYELRARDAAGNVSDPSNTTSATTPPAALFSDGFETGDFSLWTSATGLIVQQDEVFSGRYAARATSSGEAAYAIQWLSNDQPDLYYRLHFKPMAQGSTSVYLLRFRTSTHRSLLGLYVSSTGKLGVRNDVAGHSTTSTVVVTQGEWHEVQVHLIIDGDASQVEVWYDGTRVDELSMTLALGTTPVGRIQLGENASGRTFDYVFDDVAVDTAFIGAGGGGGGSDTTPPETTITSAPPATTEQTSATFEFTASEPATFQCQLDDGQAEPCTSPHTYDGLAAGSHTFAVVATDQAGNTDPTPATYAWEITAPSQAPDTALTETPPALTNETTASFSFSSDDPNATFECQLDGSPFAPCQSPVTTTDLAEGGHDFAVRAVNAQGPDPTPATWQWTVDLTPPTAPTDLAASVDGSTGHVTLTWTASSDTNGISGYDVLRDGITVATLVPDPGFTDTTTQPNTTYTYAVVAWDAAGNASAESAPVTVTVDSLQLFSDGFESGDFSQWSSVNGLVISTEDPHTGSYAARATSTGPATYAIATLPQTVEDGYYRVWFKVVSQGSNTVYLIKLRTADHASLGGIYVSKTGRLSYRNDVSSRSRSTSVTVSQGEWHELQVRLVTGSNGLIEIWYDGTQVVSEPEEFGSTPVGRVQLGENSSGRTYDVVFDDVTVDTSFVR